MNTDNVQGGTYFNVSQVYIVLCLDDFENCLLTTSLKQEFFCKQIFMLLARISVSKLKEGLSKEQRVIDLLEEMRKSVKNIRLNGNDALFYLKKLDDIEFKVKGWVANGKKYPRNILDKSG